MINVTDIIIEYFDFANFEDKQHIEVGIEDLVLYGSMKIVKGMDSEGTEELIYIVEELKLIDEDNKPYDFEYDATLILNELN